MKVLHIVRHKLNSEIWIHSFYSYYFAVLSDAGIDIESTYHVLVRENKQCKEDKCRRRGEQKPWPVMAEGIHYWGHVVTFLGEGLKYC